MIEYLAGIFDAEGYVRIRRTKNNKAINYNYTPEVRLYMCDYVIVKHLANLYDLTIKKDKRGKYRKIAYHVTLGVNKLKTTTFLRDFLPYAQEKRLQLQEVYDLLNKNKDKETCYQNYMKAKKIFDHPIIKKLSYKYLAGIIDGDGWFSMFNASRKGESIYNNYSVGIQQRYKPMIEYMTQFGGSNVHQCKIYNYKSHVQTWSWQCTTIEILPFLKKIYPYLIEKKEKCGILINYIEKQEEFRKFSKKTLSKW